MNVFKKTIMVHGQPEIAKVNRKTGVLYLSSDIWGNLPQNEKEFVLFHEQGHLKLQTADEFKANAFAVGKFSPAGTFTNKELGNRIMVMRSILDKADGQRETSNFAWGTLIGSAIGPVMENLSVLGIGSKSRQKEAETIAKGNVAQLNAQTAAAGKSAKRNTNLLIIGGVLVLISIAIYFTLRK